VRKVVAITGASAGIGRAAALHLGRQGHAVAICARRRERLEAVATEVDEIGGEALPIVADVTVDADMEGFVARTVERFGRLDVMICNAGFGLYGAIDDIAPLRMQRLLDVNYMGTYRAARAALPVFRRQRAGHLMFVSSIVGKRGVPFMGTYAATKFAQVGLAECLRAELVGTGIDVSTVIPVSTESEFLNVATRESGYSPGTAGPRQTAEAVAEAMARAIERPVPEVYPYRKARYLAWLNAVAPGTCDRLVRKWGRQPVRDDR
jgi:short-subunit dehydrogenase